MEVASNQREDQKIFIRKDAKVAKIFFMLKINRATRRVEYFVES